MLTLAGALGCRSPRASEPERTIHTGRPAAQPTEAAHIPEPSDSRPVIVAFGDSLTAGYGAEAGRSYPDFLQKLLDDRHYEYRILNLGISGNTTKDGVERLKDVLAQKPAIVIVEFGGNDGLRGLPIESTRDNLDDIVRRLQGAGVQVVLAGITLPPNYGADYIDQFNKTYVFIARKHKLPLLPFLLRGAYGVPGSMQEDQIHATAQGNQQVARNVFELLTPLLEKPRSKGPRRAPPRVGTMSPPRAYRLQ